MSEPHDKIISLDEFRVRAEEAQRAADEARSTVGPEMDPVVGALLATLASNQSQINTLTETVASMERSMRAREKRDQEGLGTLEKVILSRLVQLIDRQDETLRLLAEQIERSHEAESVALAEAQARADLAERTLEQRRHSPRTLTQWAQENPVLAAVGVGLTLGVGIGVTRAVLERRDERERRDALRFQQLAALSSQLVGEQATNDTLRRALAGEQARPIHQHEHRHDYFDHRVLNHEHTHHHDNRIQHSHSHHHDNRVEQHTHHHDNRRVTERHEHLYDQRQYHQHDHLHDRRKLVQHDHFHPVRVEQVEQPRKSLPAAKPAKTAKKTKRAKQKPLFDPEAYDKALKLSRSVEKDLKS